LHGAALRRRLFLVLVLLLLLLLLLLAAVAAALLVVLVVLLFVLALAPLAARPLARRAGSGALLLRLAFLARRLVGGLGLARPAPALRRLLALLRVGLVALRAVAARLFQNLGGLGPPAALALPGGPLHR